MVRFMSDNRRWLGAGLLLTFASAFGQTWFIALFAGDIRAAHGLSDGGWGGLYTAASLCAAALLFARGALADTMPLGRLAPLVALLFAASAALMAAGEAVWTLGLAVFGLRFCGHGMFSHIALTATGRWFVSGRGRAVSLVMLGFSLAEVVLIVPTVALIGSLGWRSVWGIAAVATALVVTPALALLLARDRTPEAISGTRDGAAGMRGVQWTRQGMVRHWLFWALLPLVLTPGFIGTLVFFHQAHVAEVKGWTLAQMAPGYPFYAATTIGSALVAGWVADRFGPARLLPVLLLPMGLGVALIGPAETPPAWWLAFALTGFTQGIAGSLWGALLPAAYGARHLGSVRSLVTTIMVVSTSIGPGLTGALIDRAVSFPEQGLALGLWCLVLSLGATMLPARLRREGLTLAKA